MNQLHEYYTVGAPWGERVYIDKGIWPLVQFLWKTGVRTTYSCENQGNELGWYVAFVPDNPIVVWDMTCSFMDDPLIKLELFRNQLTLETVGILEQRVF